MGRLFLFLVIGVQAVLPGLGEETPEERLEPLLITGLAIPAPSFRTDADVIGGAAIRRMGSDFLLDSLAASAGVFVRQAGGRGGVAGVRIRGASASDTLVVIDGVVVNDMASPDGGFDFSRLGAFDTARVEILRGPHSLQFGGGGVGGVVNIITGRDHAHAGQIEAGSFATNAAAASMQTAGQQGSFGLSASFYGTGGISRADSANAEPDGVTRAFIAGRGRFDHGRVVVRSSLRHADTVSAYDGFDASAPGFVADADRVAMVAETSGHVSLAIGEAETLSSIATLGYALTARRDEADGLLSFASRSERFAAGFRAYLDRDPRHRSVLGVSWTSDAAFDRAAQETGLFAIHEFSPAGTFVVTLGGRLSADARYGSVVIGRGEMSWQTGRGIVLRAGFGQGFKPPTPYQTHAFFPPADGPAEHLDPETSDGWSIGALFAGGGNRLRLTYFGRRSVQQLAFRDGAYVNLDTSASHGMEIDTGVRFGERVSGRAWLSWSAGSENGRSDQSLPAVIGGARLVVAKADVSLAVELRHVGAHRQFNGPLPAWTRLDAAGRWQINRRVEVYARIENLLDADYQEVVGYASAGLSGRIGVRLVSGAAARP